ncbi:MULTISPECIES: DUF6387 family protein [unclassified Serratia (in: enterobacteria)]|uniref:DUF6387 family protein n=1 Tax=unclassified Serratia (in: enterobacteria) TaxID=2647522 RepID=UPI0004680921|nr:MULTISPECIES: DUF6387 family protein [unclassified Serratia (in: enterobacteria)]
MNRKATFEDLGWFDIKNYDVFKGITVGELINEILARYELMVNLKSAKANGLHANQSLLISSDKQYNCITNGNPRLYKCSEEWSNQEVDHFRKKNTKEKVALKKSLAYIEYQTGAARLLKGEDIQLCYLQMIERMSGMIIKAGYGPMDSVKAGDVLASHNIPSPGVISVAINLGSNDEDILSAIKSSLRFWRKEYHECRHCIECCECHECHECHDCQDVDECKKYADCMFKAYMNKKAFFTDISLLSIFDNHTLAVMDLYLWAFNNQVTIRISDFDKKLHNYSKKDKSLANPSAFKKRYLSKAETFLGIGKGRAYDFFDDFIHRVRATPEVADMTEEELRVAVKSYRTEKTIKRKDKGKVSKMPPKRSWGGSSSLKNNDKKWIKLL